MHACPSSSDQEWGEIKSLPLGVFTEEEAIEFIEKAFKDVVALEGNEVKRLGKKLQYLPLALREAVAYIKMENQGLGKWTDEKFTVNNYLELCKEKASELLSRKSSETCDRYTETVMTTWQTTIDKIKQKRVHGGEQALEILDVMAYLAPGKIPIDEIFSKLIGDEEVRHSAVELLDQYSMANLESGKLNIHRLVQQVTRINLDVQNKEKDVLKDALILLQEPMEEGRSIRGSVLGECIRGISHAVSVWDHVSKYGELIDDFYFNTIYGREKKYSTTLTQNGHYETTKAILTYIEGKHLNKLSETVNTRNSDGDTLILFAVESGNLNLVKFLVEKGAYIDIVKYTMFDYLLFDIERSLDLGLGYYH